VPARISGSHVKPSSLTEVHAGPPLPTLDLPHGPPSTRSRGRAAPLADATVERLERSRAIVYQTSTGPYHSPPEVSTGAGHARGGGAARRPVPMGAGAWLKSVRARKRGRCGQHTSWGLD
jgi:hypothetical protein